MIARLIVRALRRVSIGIVAGGAIAAGLARAMRALLFGVSPLDPMSFGAVLAAVVLLALAATLLPGIRAVRDAPLSVLREG